MAFYRLLADLVVVLHFAYVAFVVGGMAAILAGIALHWPWVRNFWFRTIHLLMIGVVVLESVCHVLCPLTEWENRLRELGGQTADTRSFIGRWVHRLMFVDASSTALTTGYCLFGLAVLLVWIFAPPRWPWKRRPRLWRRAK
jgi:hypothetical protein